LQLFSNGQTITFAKNTMRFLKLSVIISVLIIAFFSCKKNSDFNTTPNFYILNGGTTGFTNSLILFPASDTITYNLIISSTYFLSKTVTINLAVDDSYRQSYNVANGTNYQLMPSNAFSFQNTITAGTGSSFDTIPVTLHKSFLASGDYMLPIKISSVSDYTIDTSANVIYLHTTNSELSGIYNSSGLKVMYNGDAGDSSVNASDSFSLTKNLIPNGTNSELDYADLGGNGWKYILGFSTDGGAFFVNGNNIIQSSVEPGSFKVLQATFDSTTKDIYIKTSYKNASGNERIVEESLTLQ
jgi:hypothetical protein